MGSILKEVPQGDLLVEFQDQDGSNKYEEREEVVQESAPKSRHETSTTEPTAGRDSVREVVNDSLACSLPLRETCGTQPSKLFDEILLAWMLFHRRGSLGFSDEDFLVSWAIEPSLGTPTHSCLISEVVQADKTVADCLEGVRSQSASAKATSPGTASTATLEARLASNGTSEHPLFAIRASVGDPSLSIDCTHRHHELSDTICTAYLRTILDLFTFVSTHPTSPATGSSQIQPHELSQIWNWNHTLPPAINRTIHSYFIERAQAHRDAPAVVSWDGDFTYAEVDRMSTQLAHKLCKLGVKNGKPIPCCFEKSAWTVIAVLAIMKAGGAFVLTDPSQPEGRLQTICEEAKADIVLTSERYVELGRNFAPAAKVLPVGLAMMKELVDMSTSELETVSADGLMYIIFTSGSTGKPKGVMITHKNYTTGAIPRAEIVGYEPDTRVLDFASYAFDVSIDCMLLTLATGGCICVPSDDDRVNNLSGAIRKMNVNMVHTTPSIARVFDADVIPSLKVLGLGGEAVPAHDASVWNEQTRVVVAYGPSECTVGCTFSNDVGKNKSYTSLGKGCGGLLWIIDPDDHDRLSPLGGAGELLVEGTIVGKGYLNEPEKTAAAFIKDPKWLVQGAEGFPGRSGRLYKTGDLVKYDPDGSGAVVFVGRKDQQVKIRGQRVELEEVEHHLRQRLPEKTAVAAEVISPGGDGDPTLAAFVVEQDLKQEQTANGSCKFSLDFQNVLVELEKNLVKGVPKYMVPGAFVPLPEIPTTVSGKTDRKQLRATGASLSRKQLSSWRGPPKANELIRPLSNKEQTIARLWAKVLGDGPEISAEDNFFALGGDSLKAMRLVAAARGRGVLLTISTIFANPSLADMASKAEKILESSKEEVPLFSLLGTDWTEQDARRQTAEACGVDEEAIEDVYPCTPLQEGLMALSAKVPEAYVAQRVLRLPDRNAAEKLRDAFESAAKNCVILRTRIVHVSPHGLVQVVMKECPQWQEADDLQVHLARDREETMELGTSLCRFALIEDKKSGAVDFVLTMHHALYDGWSMSLVVDRVNRAYQGLERVGRTEFKVFIKHLREQDRKASERYWRELLEGADSRQCPALPYPDYQAKADSLLERYISLANASKSSNTLATIIRGAWALTASQYSRSPDMIFGETLTGRNADVLGIEEIEAPLITTVPMRLVLKGTLTVSDYLKQVHQQTIDRIPHEHLGLQNIRLLNRDARHACDLRTGFVLHPCEDEDTNRITGGPASGLVPAGDTEAAQEALKFNSYALMMVCTLEKKGFLTMASFDSKTIFRERMQELLAAFEKHVQQLCSDGDRLLSDICELPQESTSKDDGAYVNGRIGDPACSAVMTNGRHIDGVRFSGNGTSAEQLLIAICKRILRLEEIDATDSFFDLGGDSIGAMKLVSELRQAGYKLTVAQIFANRQLSMMAKLLGSAEPSNGNIDVIHPKSARDRHGNADLVEKVRPTLHSDCQILDVYPARPLQDIALTGTTELPRYSVRYELFFMDGRVDKDRLFESCRRLIAMNEVLRTTFVRVDQKCYGVALDKLEDLIAEYETDSDVESFARKLCDIDVQSRMPAGSQFVKFFFIESTAGKTCLIFRLSHAQYDEICLPIMLRQLSALYQGETVEEPVSFSSFVRHVVEDNLPRCIEYWRKLLRGSSMSILPGPEIKVQNRRRLTSITQTINLSRRPKGVTVATFPTAAWALCLARRLAKRDVVFGEVVSGRNTGFPDADRVVGPCWQYVPSRVQIQENWTGHDLLQAVQHQHIASSEFEGIGLPEIVEHCTDWPRSTDWFDSVVHQDVAHVESLPFSLANSRMETYYPHLEPLREWKIQAFAGRDEMTMEVVTFEEWRSFGKELLRDIMLAFEQLVNEPGKLLL
ncbi:NRPS [Knufia obscura]|uniref:NRPS n=1 Tax=Knufia obscura TaxID=1635080 RepID=A0ABR0R8X9_9EURO|nr:NRPS [Knufia obscura]